MRTVTYKLADLKKAVIHLGKVAENDATRVRIDAAEIFGDYPAAQVALSVTNPVGETYPATVQRDGDFVVWDVKDSSLTAEGDGEIQISFSQNGAKIRSEVGRTKICRSIIGEGEEPDPVKDWVDQAEELLEDVEEALGAFPTGGTTGQVLAKKSNDDHDTEWVDQGAGGVSDYDDLENRPQIGGVTLTGDKSLHDLGAAAESDIPDVSGFYTKPANGIPASDIAAGVIPDPTSIIDDAAGAGDTDKTWSADKLTSDVLSTIQQKSDIFKTTKTGNPLIVSDKMDDAPFDSFVLDYLPVQNGVGVPSPTNIRQFVNRITLDINLSGEDTSDPETRHILFPVHGKNMYDEVSFPLTQGRYIGAANGVVANSDSYAATLDYVPCELLAGKTVTLNKRPGGNADGVAFYSANDGTGYISGEKNSNVTAGQPWTFDVPSNAKFMRFTVPANTENIQIEIGQSSTSYEPFYGTGYGGKINLKTGLMTVEYVCETANSGAWTVASSGNAYQFGHTACNWGVNKDAETQLCSHWHNIIYYNNGSVILNANGALYVGTEFWQAVGITPTAETVAAYFAAQKAAGTPLYVCAKLKTPYEIQLSMEELEAIAGKNIVWSGRDTTITATYSADTKGYIDRPSMDQKRILVFGDSLWGADRTEGVADFLKEYSGATVFNAGIGGTMINGDRVGSDAYKAFDGASLIHAYVTGDYTDQNAYQTQMPSYVVLETLPMLKSTDIQTIDIVILAYGTNDFEAGRTAQATATAFLTAISELLTVNPKMRIICILPPWRMFSNDTVDGDVYENSNNQTTVEFADAVCDALQVKHILTMNMSRELPWRAETKEYYMDSDAIHPNKEGNKIYAHVVNGKLRSMY